MNNQKNILISIIVVLMIVCTLLYNGKTFQEYKNEDLEKQIENNNIKIDSLDNINDSIDIINDSLLQTNDSLLNRIPTINKIYENKIKSINDSSIEFNINLFSKYVS